MGATAAVAGQNLGAGHPDRTIRGVHVAAKIGVAAAAAIGALFLLIPRILLAAFGMTEAGVVDLAVELLTFLSVSGFFISVALVYTGGLQGTGDTKSPFYISVVSQLAEPLILSATLQQTAMLTATWIWTAILLGHLTRCGLSVVRFRQGLWRSIRVDIEPAPER